MKLIAHRGLMHGPDTDKENTVEQIELALAEGYDVEIDVWWKHAQWWLGHDEPKTIVDFSFLKKEGLWIHCKNDLALEKLNELHPTLNYFWHHIDCYTLTSKNVPWVYPGKRVMRTGVCVLPELEMSLADAAKLDVYAICSDYVSDIKGYMKCK